MNEHLMRMGAAEGVADEPMTTVDRKLKISRILHAGYLFESGTCVIAFDPIFENPFSTNCHAFPEVRFDLDAIRGLRLEGACGLRLDAVFISHYHDDHCSLASLDLIARDTPIYLYCQLPELFELIRALGFQFVYALEIDVAISVGRFSVTPRRALNSGVDSMFQVSIGGLQILNVVDSEIDAGTLDLLEGFAPWDLVLWPFQTMLETAVLTPSRSEFSEARDLPAEWLSQLSLLNPRYVVPSSCQFRLESWSWYNQVMFPVSYARLLAKLSEPS